MVTASIKQITAVAGNNKPSSPYCVWKDAQLQTTLVAAIVIRITLFCSPLASVAESRPELSTPPTGWRELKECVWMYRNGYDQYDGGLCFHPPLVVLAFATLPSLGLVTTSVIWSTADALVALCLALCIDRKELLSPTRRTIGQLARLQGSPFSPYQMAAIYLFSPFSLLSTLARSTVTFSHLSVAAATLFSLKGELAYCMYSLSVGTQLSVYPALLVPLGILILSKSISKPARHITFKALCYYFGHLLLCHYVLSLALHSSETYFPSVYKTLLTIPDLSPNVGLHWYFSIEMFDHFRSFFAAVFQLLILVWVAPLSIKFKREPLFALVLMCGVVATLKSYPSVGDVAFFHSLLPLFPSALTRMRHPFLTVSLYLYACLLLPIFHRLWIVTGSGNANFYYASTLVWAIANGELVIDYAYGYCVAEVEWEMTGSKGLIEGKEEITQA